MTDIKKKDLGKYKQRLEELKDSMTRLLQGATAEVKTPEEATGYSQHQADQGTDDFDRTISLEITSSEYAILRQINRALEKFEEGTYGICDHSGEPIPVARLEAVPYATMTVEAQEQQERSERGFI